MCNIYITLPSTIKIDVLSLYKNDSYFSIRHNHNRMHNSVLYGDDIIYEIITDIPLHGIGKCEQIKRLKELYENESNNDLKDLRGQLLSDQMRIIDFDLFQLYHLIKELIWDWQITKVGIVYTFWPDDIPPDIPLNAPIHINLHSLNESILYHLTVDTILFIHL